MSGESKIKRWGSWFVTTSTFIGMPVTLLLVCWGVQGFIFTTTCQLASFKCEYAFGATNAMTNFMEEMVASNSSHHLASVPNKSKQ